MMPLSLQSDRPRHPDPSIDEMSAVVFLERHRWGAAPYCPACGSDHVYAMSSQGGKGRNKRFLWRCRACQKQYTVRTGTILEESLLPLHIWCRVVKAASESDAGISALRIAEVGGVSHKTALYLLRRLRSVLPPRFLREEPVSENGTANDKRADIQPIRIVGEWQQAIAALMTTGLMTDTIPTRVEADTAGVDARTEARHGSPPLRGHAALHARHGRAIRSLSDEDLAEAIQIADRLRAVLRRLLEHVPKECRTPTSLSRHFVIERTIVQRLFSAFAGAESTAHSLIKAPGSKAMRTFAEAARANGLDQDADALLWAVAQLERFFSRVGGTQRAYADLLLLREAADASGVVVAREPMPRSSVPLETFEAPVHDRSYAERRSFYESARRFVGRWSKTQVQMLIYPPSETAPDMLDTVRIRGVVGTQWKASASTLMFLSMTRPDSQTRVLPPIEPLEGEAYTLARFSSRPTPLIRNEPAPNAQYYLVSHPSGGSEKPMDVIIADKTYSAGRIPTRRVYWSVAGVSCEVTYPAESLVFDVYHHRDFCHLHIPGVDAHLLPSHSPILPTMEWTTKLGIPLTLRSFPASKEACESPMYERMGDLSAHVFDAFGRDIHEYMCYRFEIAYPIWRLAYRMFFDYQPIEELAKEETA